MTILDDRQEVRITQIPKYKNNRPKYRGMGLKSYYYITTVKDNLVLSIVTSLHEATEIVRVNKWRLASDFDAVKWHGKL